MPSLPAVAGDGAMRKAAVASAGGGGKGAATTTDLLVCFPAWQRLALMPKPICSPSRAATDKAARRRSSQTPGTRSIPMFRGSKAKRMAGDDDEEEEPQSPKVTCAGQIKVGRPKKARSTATAGKLRGGKRVDGGGRSWISVVEEIERMRGRRKKVGWFETVGIRTDARPFLGGVLRSLRLKTRCLGSLHGAAVDSSADDDDDDGAGGSAAASVFSKWLMVLEGGEEEEASDQGSTRDDSGNEDHEGRQSKECPSASPPNALLLMRCRSAPAKGLSLSRRETTEPPPSNCKPDQENGSVKGDAGAEEDRDYDEDSVFMRTAPGFLKLSVDIAKETWLVGGADPFSWSRSWKR